VLVVIGLLIGGVLVGQVMIHQMELRTVATDIESYRTAYNVFRTKYNCIAGDCPLATRFWGRADGDPNLLQNCNSPETDIDAGNPKATCNGNGDGIIALTGAQQSESWRFWQHLSNAQLIPGQYTGIGGAVGSSGWRIATIGQNIPGSKSLHGGYFINYMMLSALCGGANVYSGPGANDYDHNIMFGRESTQGPPWNNVLSPQDAQTIDTKIDDGTPGRGQLRAVCANICATTADTSTAEYNLANTGVVCQLRFQLKQ
jgi:hypothetical protein